MVNFSQNQAFAEIEKAASDLGSFFLPLHSL
jgi:hypothetical protein